jgi:hypothetical protein
MQCSHLGVSETPRHVESYRMLAVGLCVLLVGSRIVISIIHAEKVITARYFLKEAIQEQKHYK